MPRTSHRLPGLLAALLLAVLLALPLAACQQDGGSEPSVTTEEAAEDGEPTPPGDPGVADPQPSPGGTEDGSTTDDEGD